MLLAYYMNRRSTDETAHNKTVLHALWFLENHPETEGLDVFLPHNNDEVAGLWQQQLDKYPDNLQVICNAGDYFSVGYTDQAIECYKLGKSLDPENSAEWDEKLAHAYRIKMMESPEQDKQAWADASLRAYEDAYANSKPLSFTTPPGYPTVTFVGGAPNFQKPVLLLEMTRMALTAGDLEKATDYANRMLENPSGPSWVYEGNYVLGMIAIQNGDLEGAGEYLLASGNIPWPAERKNPFRPNMSLAKELMDGGKRDVVLGFLKKCLNFWTSEYIPCSQWIQEIEEGETPDFSGYLNY
jgi:tetratricopeptide (TPR) repeat protein